MEFEKKRNAELMVTQRKEALHLRKQAEKNRRELQHNIEKEQRITAHQKYISRIIGKDVTHGMKEVSSGILYDQGFLKDDLISDMKEFLNPDLFKNSKKNVKQREKTEEQLEKVIKNIMKKMYKEHDETVTKEKERRHQEEERLRIEKEKKERRIAKRKEKRRKRLLYAAKTEIKGIS
jgi:hypothetical protein